MGKCIKCGRETNYSYEYYTGEWTHSFVNDRGYSKKICNHYKNIEKHREYLCSKCTKTQKIIFSGVGCFLGIAILQDIVRSLLTGKGFSSDMIVGILLSIGLIFIFVYTIIIFFIDKPFSASKGSTKLVKILHDKINKGVVNVHFFDLEKYKQLY